VRNCGEHVCMGVFRLVGIFWKSHSAFPIADSIIALPAQGAELNGESYLINRSPTLLDLFQVRPVKVKCFRRGRPVVSNLMKGRPLHSSYFLSYRPMYCASASTRPLSALSN
jgi:hypothetical protein